MQATVIRHQGFKFELRPSKAQARMLREFAGACRYVYNRALSLNQERYRTGERKLTYVESAKLLTSWRADAETPWLAEAPAQVLQQSLRDLESAYTNFFAKRAGAPRFKKKGQHDHFRVAQKFKLEEGNSRVRLPKVGWIRYRKSRQVLGQVKHVSVSSRAGRWFVSFLTAREVPKPLPTATSAVGIDLGVARFATLSDGTVYPALNSFAGHHGQLRKAQRAMDRKVKFSRNWKKAKARISKIHARIANCRRDFLHKTSTAISNNHAVVFVEDLNVIGMTASAAGTVEAPGRNVRQKAGLNRVIQDQGWYTFRRYLEYKLDWNGGLLVAVPPRNTSRTCLNCGHIAAESRLSQAIFQCVQCDFEEHADLVGAVNVLRAGEARLARQASDAVRSPAAGTHRSATNGGKPVYAQ